MKKPTRIIKLIIGVVALLGVATAGWYALVFFESQVTGERAVYLQMAAPHSMTLRWGTARSAADTVYYGRTADQLDQQQVEPKSTVNHRLRLDGLQPDTRYYYRIQHQGAWLEPQADWFVTSPLPGAPRPVRIWLWGDPGKSKAKLAVRDAGLKWLRAHAQGRQSYADMVITTGDNAYPNATNAEYTLEFFQPYQEVLKNIPLWTVLGNHDARRWTFYKLFDRPMHAEAGGLPSNSEHYFSFDYAQAHFILLDNHH